MSVKCCDYRIRKRHRGQGGTGSGTGKEKEATNELNDSAAYDGKLELSYMTVLLKVGNLNSRTTLIRLLKTCQTSNRIKNKFQMGYCV